MVKAIPATPIGVIESYFDVKLDKGGLKDLNKITDEGWFDFGKQYLETMQQQFVPQFLDTPDDDDSVRLFFEPQLRDYWGRALDVKKQATPLLGPRPNPEGEVSPQAVSKMLAPLKKHLLLADSVLIRDNFYVCFDIMAESVKRAGWQDNIVDARIVKDTIPRIKAWLPVLAELRDLIEAKALVFMPYYVTPSFPYSSDAPQLRDELRRLRMRAAARPKPVVPPTFRFEDLLKEPDPEALRKVAAAVDPAEFWIPDDDVIGAWLNAKLLGVDPVFPNKSTFSLASSLYFEGEEGPTDITSDLVSINILPFGDDKEIGIKDLVKMRKNEDVFVTMRQTVTECKRYLENEHLEDASPQAVTQLTKAFLDEKLKTFEGPKILKFAADHQAVGIGLGLAMGVALLHAPPLIPLIAGPFFSPDLALRASRRFGRKTRGIANLQALL